MSQYTYYNSLRNVTSKPLFTILLNPLNGWVIVTVEDFY